MQVANFKTPQNTNSKQDKNLKNNSDRNNVSFKLRPRANACAELGFNLKSYETKAIKEGKEAVVDFAEYVDEFAQKVGAELTDDVRVEVFPNAFDYKVAAKRLSEHNAEKGKGEIIHYGTQNRYPGVSGASTGVFTDAKVYNLGDKVKPGDHYLIGHSEVRDGEYTRESDEVINRKLREIFEKDTTGTVRITLCVGEQEKQSFDKTAKVLKDQLDIDLKGLTPDQMKRLTVAYEPVYAIEKPGGPKPQSCTPEDANRAAGFIRRYVQVKAFKFYRENLIVGGKEFSKDKKDLTVNELIKIRNNKQNKVLNNRQSTVEDYKELGAYVERIQTVIDSGLKDIRKKSKEVAEELTVQYGGSVKPDTPEKQSISAYLFPTHFELKDENNEAKRYLSDPKKGQKMTVKSQLDGALVGSAGVLVDNVVSMVRSVKKAVSHAKEVFAASMANPSA